MATSNMTFSDWQQQTNASLMSAAEELLDKLEDTSDLLSEIDEKYIRTGQAAEEEADDHKCSMIQRFHAGLDSARNLVNVLKREKWRLSKREMSVELRMGELEDYKSHLKKDMSSLNQTVDALSMRVVQLENQLVEAQEIQENMEAELKEHRNSLQDANDRNIHLYTENEDLKKALKNLSKSNLQKENVMLKDEVSLLSQENSKLKDMVRDAEALASPQILRKNPFNRRPQSSSSAGNSSPVSPGSETVTDEHLKGDNLSKLTKEFLDELSSLELPANGVVSSDGSVGNGTVAAGGSFSTTKKLPSADV